MRVLYGLERRLRRPLCLALGVFDGVHLGHQAVVSAAVRIAKRRGLVPGVLTFEPHPDAVINPMGPPLLLTTTEEKLGLLRGLGAELSIVARFDGPLARMPAERFVEETLVHRLRAQCVVVGEKWRFGAGGRGTPRLLQKLEDVLGFGVTMVPSVVVKGRKVSSTRIRDLLMRGRVPAANELLGRPYGLSGGVVAGDGVGGKLGFPTANLDVPETKLVPGDGVYAGRAGQRKLRPAVAYIGSRPTFGGSEDRRVEVHVLEPGRRVDLVGRVLRAELVARLRRDRNFPSPSALAEQIQWDCGRAREILVSLHD